VNALKRATLASGVELEVLDVGPRDAPALIFLHGFPESYRTWRHQIAHLSGRYRCVAPNQRGYGGSSKPAGVENYSTDKLIGDVFQLADALGIEKFTILGHDWGGALAWGVAILGQLQGRVTRAVIANAPHPILFPRLLWLDPEQRRASQYAREFRNPEHDQLVRDWGLGGLLMKLIRHERPRPPMESDEQAALLQTWQDRDAAFAMLNWYRASTVEFPPIEAPYALPEGYADPALPPLAIPTLVIWGMQDEALLPGNLDGLADHASDLAIVRLPGANHFVPWEAPEAVNAALDEFLTRPSPCENKL
jgi:pimeloyl-ACP methyl ester carboxylesterase